MKEKKSNVGSVPKNIKVTTCEDFISSSINAKTNLLKQTNFVETAWEKAIT